MTAIEFRQARAALGLTAVEFAERLDVDERTVRRWEAGHAIPRPIAVLIKLALKHAFVRRELGLPQRI